MKVCHLERKYLVCGLKCRCTVRRIWSLYAAILLYLVISDRLRAFPALVTCCYIDWFHSWPSDALLSVAQVVLSEECVLEQSLQASVTRLCVHIHEYVDALAKAAAVEQGRTYQVTPSLFLRMVSTFAGMLTQVWRGVCLFE